MITEDYVSFEIAELLKEKGFDADITTYRDAFIQHGNIVIRLQECLSKKRIKTPTLQMVMKWLREEKGVAVIPTLNSVLDNEKFLWDIKIVVAKTNNTYGQGWIYEKQEEACEEAIKYCLAKLI